jgi:hypothetical protein
MSCPAVAGFGVPVFVTAKSQTGSTVVVVVVLLLEELGSLVVAAIEAFAVIEATVMVDATFTTTIMFADAPEAMLGLTQVMVPVAPTAGVVQVHPAGAEIDAKVLFVGTASVNVRFEAVAGPLFVTV